MGTLLLSATWINLFSTGAAVKGYRDGDDGDDATMQGRVVGYAGGRQRGVTTEGVAGEWSFVLRGVTVTDTDTLRSWLGQTVQVRDNRGRKMHGILLSVPRTPWKEQLDLYDVTIGLLLVTIVEAV